jgi:hypothetical protein
MAAKIDIINMGLGHLGIDAEISDVDTERSTEARAARRFWDLALADTLRAADWSFARKKQSLALVETFEDVNLSEWQYSYELPTDCVAARRIVSGFRNETSSTRVPYDIEGDLLLCNESSVYLQYTRLNTSCEKFPPDFVLALSYRLAFLLSPTVCGSDSSAKKQEMLSLFRMAIDQAAVNSYNETQKDQTPDSEFIRVRET